MWKDFFYYTRSERRIIILLLVLAGGMMVFYWSERIPSSSVDVQIDTCFVDSFLSKVKKYPQRTVYPPKRKEEIEIGELFAFDPNTADSLTFRRLGVKPFVVRNILRYRLKGGVFRTSESFSRIYGLSQEEYVRLKPYINLAVIDERKEPDRLENVRDTLPVPSVRDKLDKFQPGMVVELNQADTTMLKRIPGIGSGIAKMIVTYRERLGGFYRVEQLQEIEYVGQELNVWFKVSGQDAIRQLSVNKLGLDALRRHPYMNFYKAKAILEYRRKRGAIRGISQLAMMEEFTEEDLKRLSPYLSFE